jgi:basic amino acid/polyamine antiporter, APA family
VTALLDGHGQRNTIFRHLPISQALAHAEPSRHGLRRVYRRLDLVILGIGVMVGAGIFKLAAEQAAGAAGPAVLLSFVIAGVVCLLSALCYAELASTVPVAGSAYTFSYIAFGEVIGWLAGWAILLEMLLAVAVVSRAWSLYFSAMLDSLGVELPASVAARTGLPTGFDLGNLAILVLVVTVVALGGRLGVRVLWAMVLAKLAVISAVIMLGFPRVRPSNLAPLIPPAQPGSDEGGRTVFEALLGQPTQTFGPIGIFGAAATIAFAYIGFDIVATSAEETRQPRENIGGGMVSGLLIVTGLYLGVAFVLVGMLPYHRLGESDTPLPDAFEAVGVSGMGTVVSVGAVIGLTTVVLVALMGASRVALAMARDGLLPAPMAAISPRFRTPATTTLLLGAVAVAASEWLDILTYADLLVLAAVFAFVVVALAVMRLRRTHPELRRGFTVPLFPVVPLLAVLTSLWLMLGVPVKVWGWFLLWMSGGLVIYMLYGRLHSRLHRLINAQAEQERFRADRDLRHRGLVAR